MEKSCVGRYVRETQLSALRSLKPAEYMRYVDEEGRFVWMAAAPVTWPNGDPIFINLRTFMVSEDTENISCLKKIRAGLRGRQSYAWTGTLQKGVWTWEE